MEDAATRLQQWARGRAARCLTDGRLRAEVSGWLWRQGILRPRRVWCVQNGKQLQVFGNYYQLLNEAIELVDARCYSTVPHAGHAFCFRLVIGGRSTWFAAESADERRRWVTTILQHAPGRIGDAPPARNRILFLYGRGGGGHKASANAVRDCLEQDVGSGVQCDVVMGDLGLLLEAPVLGERVKRVFNRLGVPGGDDVYNYFMSKGWYRLADVSTRMGSRTIDRNATVIGDWLCGYFAAERPSLVVSFIPFVNRVLREALGHCLPGVQILTVITDMEHSEAHRWIDPFDSTASKHTIVAGGSRLQRQAMALGYEGARVLGTGGMVVHPAYYQTRCQGEPPAGGVGDRLEPSLPTVVLFFGGFGPPLMETIAEQLLLQFRLNLVMLVGKNEALAAKCDARINAGDPLWTKCPVLVDGFIPPATLIEYISQANCVVGKPGPGVVSEAAVLGVPFVTEHNERTMAQEVCVVDFIRSEGIGVVVHSLTDAFPPDLFEQLEGCRRALASVSNNAVFDVSACCQEAVRRARTGLAAEPEAPRVARLSVDCRTRMARRPSLAWADIVTHFNDANADAVSGRNNSFSGRYSFAG